MSLDRAALSSDARRVVRIIGDELLARVRKKAEDLRANEDPEALHDFRVAVRRLRSWLRAFENEFDDTLRGKYRRGLDRIADATRDSRDLEVHIAWVERFARARRKRTRAGSDWLIARMRGRKARADLTLRRVLDEDFARTESGLRKAFAHYTVTRDETPALFARVTAKLVRQQAVAVRSALANVSTIGDRVQGHDARIAAKRLRYLLEPFRDLIDGTGDVVTRLTTLQDDFGALHDAQIFGSEIARALAKVRSSKESDAARAADDGTPDAVDDTADSDRADVLEAISRRLHRDENAAFARAVDAWLGDNASDLWPAVETIAVTLDDIAVQDSSFERRYLLREVLETPPGRTLEIDVGYLPGAHIVEHIQRVTSNGERRYRRALESDDASCASTVDEEISKEVFTALWPLTQGRRVKTHRRSIDFEGRCWVIDDFSDREIALATVRLADADDAVAIPAWLEPMIDHDVTDAAAYTLRALAGA